MTIKNVLLSYFPTNLKKGAEIFSNLVADVGKSTGVIENELIQAKDYIMEWGEINDVYDETQVTKDKLEKIVDFFSFIEKFTDETDKSLRARFAALFKRSDDNKWGSPLNIKHVFEQYFSLAEIFVVENTNDSIENLIENGDFEKSDTQWIFQNAELAREARFCKGLGALLYGEDSSISQSIEVESNHSYFLHFFHNGDGKVGFTRLSDGKWWDNTNKTWTNQESFAEFNSDKWQDYSIWIRTEDFNDTVKIVIKSKEDKKLYVDYARFYLKHPYPSFTVIIHFEGKSSMSAMALAGGREDPVKNVEKVYINDKDELLIVTKNENPLQLDEEGNLISSEDGFVMKNGELFREIEVSDIPPEVYKQYFYYDHAFFTGSMSGFAMDLYMDVLTYLKAVGVKARLEILVRDYFEDEED